MKYILTILVLSFDMNEVNAQTGSLALNCIDYQTSTALATIRVEIIVDSILLFNGTTNAEGNVLFRYIPVGLVEVRFSSIDNTPGFNKNYYIQSGQLLREFVLIDSNFIEYRPYNLLNYQFSRNGVESASFQSSKQRNTSSFPA